jgi:predicted AAA+ superfamily ATPase
MEHRVIQRDIENQIRKWLFDREIIAIRGPRQSGKTTMLGVIRDKLIKKGIDADDIHFFSFEDTDLRIKFEENPKEFVDAHVNSTKKNYFLLDEIQYLKDPGQKLKSVFDSYKNIKIIITGSSSFDLTQLGRFLVGRIVFFNLYPFSFHEFLRAKGKKYENIHNKVRLNLESPDYDNIQKTVFLGDLNKLMHEYLTFGSYPRVVLERSREKKIELLRNMFITYVEKDIVGLYGIKYRDNVVRLLKSISSMLGSVVKFETLSEHSGLKYHRVRELMPLLVDSFVISLVKPYHRNLLNELRKNPKIYFVDYGLRNHLLENFDNVVFDSLYENFFHNEVKGSFDVRYWRTTAKTEVDFILERNKIVCPVEIKTKPKITRSFRSFIGHYRPRDAFVYNLDSINQIDIGTSRVHVLPLCYL